MKLNFLIFISILVSCTTRQNDNGSKMTSEKDTIAQVDTLIPSTEIIETFVDSLNIGEKGKAKIELIKHRIFDNVYVIVKFYTKGLAYWNHQNTYLYECDALMGLDPDLSDFNNDNFNDITFVSATAARTANEVRRLFIYDDYTKQLTSIVNSQNYPNMLYNNELNCIDAFLVHGGSTTVFAKIKGDSLKEFANINNDNYRTVYEVDQFGKEKLIQKDTIENPEDIYIRYINYKPVKQYDK